MGKTTSCQEMANALVDNAINDGFQISITGKQIVVERSRNFSEIIKAMFSTDMDTLTLNVEERRVGIITLIYGNGNDGQGAIGDNTDAPHINRLVEQTLKGLEPISTPSLQGPDEPLIGDFPANSHSPERWISREIRRGREPSRAEADVW